MRIRPAVNPSHPPPSRDEPNHPSSSQGGSPIVANRWRLVPALALLIVTVDQLTKQWAESALASGPLVIIPGLLSLSYTENPGASFSMFQDGGPVLGLAALVAVVVIWLALRSVHHGLEVMGLALIMGGAVGNFVDRVVRGHGFFDGAVIDFIALPNFPSFNVADSAITMGAVLLIWSAILARH